LQVAFTHAICVENVRSHGYHLQRVQNASALSSAYSAFRTSGVLLPPSSKAHLHASSAVSLLQLGSEAESKSVTARFVGESSPVPRLAGNALLLSAALTAMAVFVVPRMRARMRTRWAGLHLVSLEEPDGTPAAASSQADYGTGAPHIVHIVGAGM
jgi:hypothetical protein